MSKGSKPRPVVKKVYDNNYDAIQWKTKKIEPKQNKAITITQTK